MTRKLRCVGGPLDGQLVNLGSTKVLTVPINASNTNGGNAEAFYELASDNGEWILKFTHDTAVECKTS